MSGGFKFLFFSALGLFMFFCPLELAGKSSIPVDHIIIAIRTHFPKFGPFYAVTVMILGTFWGIRKKVWKKSPLSAFFFAVQLIGLVIGIMVYFNFGPAWMLTPGMAPYIFDLVAIPVGLVIPIGSIFLTFLVSYGLMEFTGELMTPVMRPLFKTPGKSAIDAVASFVGSYSVGLIITNNVYKSGGYTAREASVIATGFSTVSATFMIIVAKTLGLMESWNLYFWVTLFVTFLVTAITIRLPPLSRIPDSLYPGSTAAEQFVPDSKSKQGIFSRAWNCGVRGAENSQGFFTVASRNFFDGIKMATTVVAAILAFGVLALAMTKYTMVFDYAGYIYYPFFRLFDIPDAMLAAKSSFITIADMAAPSIVAKDAPHVTKFILAVISISEVLFFSGMLPCLFGTDIPLRMRDVFVIWFERVTVSILITAPIALYLF